MRFIKLARTSVLTVCGLLVLIGACSSNAGQAVGSNVPPDDISQQSFKADRDLVQAVARKDTRAIRQFLDPEFTWTDAQGRTLTKSQVVEKLPAPALSDESEVKQFEQVNDRIVIHRSERNKIYVLRVWVRRPAGWRALVYQEVNQSGAQPHGETGGQACENPCKSVPFHPKTEDEHEVIQAYQGVESAVAAHNSAAWGSHIADEFFAVTSNSDHPIDKRTRMAGLDQQKEGGIAPFPLVSARMFQFADTMVMTSLQQPEHDKALHVTRIWTKQAGRWLEIFSYQTTIQSAGS